LESAPGPHVQVKRVFVAVDVSEEVRKAVSHWIASAKDPEARWVSAEKLHLTLAFLGTANPAQVTEALQGIRIPTMHLVAEGFGAFPSARRARVLWIGLGGQTQVLTELAAEVTRRLAPIAPQMDGRALKPHLTIARYRQDRMLGPLPDFVPVSSTVNELVMYESRLGRGGSTYTALATFRDPKV
jgi:2'-5' RNA ligase